MHLSDTPLTTVLLVATLVIWIGLELRQSLTERTEAKHFDRGSLLVLRVLYPVGVIIAVELDKHHVLRIHPLAVSTWLGLSFLWCGAALRLWSFRTLGRYFTFTVQTSDDQPVISTGPYRVVRHPGYAGLILAITGIGFLFDSWASLASLILFLSVPLIYRIRVEELALARDLGGRYQTYATGRKRLIPFIW